VPVLSLGVGQDLWDVDGFRGGLGDTEGEERAAKEVQQMFVSVCV